ncbi:hypothetical protein HMPREF9058_0751 [Actinomyces sp. oral taxon 175 str. F0384]|nr:hypothetical protein HMPREF9058_0751 [Actinomyces sp. oral taxon 175 str. F0384]
MTVACHWRMRSVRGRPGVLLRVEPAGPFGWRQPSQRGLPDASLRRIPRCGGSPRGVRRWSGPTTHDRMGTQKISGIGTAEECCVREGHSRNSNHAFTWRQAGMICASSHGRGVGGAL